MFVRLLVILKSLNAKYEISAPIVSKGKIILQIQYAQMLLIKYNEKIFFYVYPVYCHLAIANKTIKQ